MTRKTSISAAIKIHSIGHTIGVLTSFVVGQQRRLHLHHQGVAVPATVVPQRVVLFFSFSSRTRPKRAGRIIEMAGIQFTQFAKHMVQGVHRVAVGRQSMEERRWKYEYIVVLCDK